MSNRRSLVSMREIIYIVLALAVYFEIYLLKPIPLFRYVDECVAVLCLLIILMEAFKKKLEMSQVYILLLLVLVLCIGLASTYYNRLQTKTGVIVGDIGNCFKVFVTYVGATLFLRPVRNKKIIITTLATVMRFFVLILFGGLLLHLVGIVPMGMDFRYGIPSYQFINDGAAQLTYMFYAMFVVFTLDLRYTRRRTGKMLFIVMAAIVWAFTLRTRAFLFIAIYFCMYWVLVAKGRQIKMNWKTILLVFIFLVVFSLEQIDTYFGENKSARYWLLYYGIFSMNYFFPLGAGFACYGTDAAVSNYSKLYISFGFTKVWGLQPEYAAFAHDSYWPAIMGQFGAFGLAAMVMVVIQWCVDIIKRTRFDKFSYLAGLFMVVTQVASSTMEATFFNFVTVALCFIMPVMFEDSGCNRLSAVAQD